MRKRLLLLTALCLTPTIGISVASAQTQVQKQITIELDNGQSDSRPMSIQAVDPWSGKVTTYVPIWYAMHALQSTKSIQSTWDGRNWNIKLPSNVKSNLYPAPHPGSGPLKIYVNGTYVQDAEGIIRVDPSSGVPTTYVPIWYVMQALKHANITSTWDGSDWQLHTWLTKWDVLWALTEMSQNSGEITGVPLSLQSNDTTPNPYDDVQSNTWATIDSAIQDHVVQPDSPTHFGMDDPATVSWLDQIYWNWVFYSFNNLTPVSHTQYEPGGNPQSWAQIIGLNNGISQSPVLLYTDADTFASNMSNISSGTSFDTNGHHVVYTPIDEYNMFASSTGTVALPPNEETAIIKTYQEFNGISYSSDWSENNDYEFILPAFPLDSQWHIRVSGLFSDSQWSMDGGKTWTTLGEYKPESTNNVFGNFVYDSSNATLGGSAQAPSQVLIKTNQNVTVSFSEDIGGKTYDLGQIQFTANYHDLPGVQRNKNPF